MASVICACGLTAEDRDQLRNPNALCRVWDLTLVIVIDYIFFCILTLLYFIVLYFIFTYILLYLYKLLFVCSAFELPVLINLS